MHSPIQKKTTDIPVGEINLKADIVVPQNAMGIVLFVHGSGSSRLSPRNRMVSDYLNDAGMATLLFDLLTPSEDSDRNNRFNISLLVQRLKAITEWVVKQLEYKDLPISFFGASTGAAAALVAASKIPFVAAVVSRGGRPDLAKEALPLVTAPTLLLIGSLDTEVITLNQQALANLHCEKKLEIVPGATHLFEEPGTMEQVCALAAQWFIKHFQTVAKKIRIVE